MVGGDEILKHGKCPNLRQANFIADLKFRGVYLVPDNWFVVKDTPEILQIVKRNGAKSVRTWSKKENHWIN